MAKTSPSSIKFQTDTTALVSPASSAVTTKGRVGQSAPQSDASYFRPQLAIRECMNYESYLGAHNVGKSVAISKFKDAVDAKVKEIGEIEDSLLRKIQRRTAAIASGNTTNVRKLSGEIRDLHDAKQVATTRLAVYQLALSNCMETGHSDPSQIPVRTQVQTAPEDTLVVEDLVTPEGEVVTAVINGNGEVVAAAPSPLASNLLSPKNIALGALALGLGYVLIRRRS
jgi:hypothetical protein